MVSFSHCCIWGKKGEKICLQIQRPLRFDDIDKLITDHRQELIDVKQPKVFLLLHHSYYYWLINSLVTGEFTCMHTLWWNELSCSNIFTVFCGTFPNWPLASSQECMLLASFQWRLSSSSITRSVHSSDTVNRWRNKCLTPLCVPPTCLDQLKSVSQLSRAVLMYRVSVNTFHLGCIKRTAL